MAMENPSPSRPISRSAGIAASVRITSRVGEPRIPILSSLWPKATPGSAFMTRKAEMPLERSSGSLVANTT